MLVVSGLQPQPLRVVQQMELHPREGELYFVANFEAALTLAATLLGEPAPGRVG